MVRPQVNRKTVWDWGNVFGSHGSIDGLSVVGKKLFYVGLFRRFPLTQPCMCIVSPLAEVAI